MNENHIINHIKTLTNKKLATLDQKKPFTINAIQKNLIIITTSKKTPRNVPLKGTINAYNHIIKNEKLTRTEIEEHEYTIRNTAYMASILASFPEIEYTIRPITLFKKPTR